MLIDEQEIRPRIVGDSDIRPAVIVEIGQHHAHPLGFGLPNARSLADISEGAIVVVVVKPGFLTTVVSRMTIRAVPLTVFSTPNVRFRRPLDVVSHNQIEPAILVVIEPSCAGGPSALIGHTGLCGYIGKGAIAIVQVENGSAVAGYVEVRVTVIVEVAD